MIPVTSTRRDHVQQSVVHQSVVHMFVTPARVRVRCSVPGSASSVAMMGDAAGDSASEAARRSSCGSGSCIAAVDSSSQSFKMDACVHVCPTNEAQRKRKVLSKRETHLQEPRLAQDAGRHGGGVCLV